VGVEVPNPTEWIPVSDRTARREEFRRKHRYVEYLCREGTTDFDALSDFLGDLQTDAAASVERVR
jgi:hypothetical protein